MQEINKWIWNAQPQVWHYKSSAVYRSGFLSRLKNGRCGVKLVSQASHPLAVSLLLQDQEVRCTAAAAANEQLVSFLCLFPSGRQMMWRKQRVLSSSSSSTQTPQRSSSQKGYMSPTFPSASGTRIWGKCSGWVAAGDLFLVAATHSHQWHQWLPQLFTDSPVSYSSNQQELWESTNTNWSRSCSCRLVNALIAALSGEERVARKISQVMNGSIRERRNLVWNLVQGSATFPIPSP